MSLPAFAAEGVSPAAEWQEVTSRTLEPHARAVILLEQTGPDLAVLTSYSDGRLFEQDSMDARYGTEVVYLDNPGDMAVEVTVAVTARYSAIPPTFLQSELFSPDTQTLELAQGLNSAAQLAYSSNDSNDAVFAVLSRVLSADRTSLLYEVASTQYIQALMAKSDFNGVITAIEQLRPATGFTADTDFYLDGLKATCLWQLRNIDAALTLFGQLEEQIRQKPEIKTVGQLLDREHLRARHGATTVIAGLRNGDQQMMRRGAFLIDQALSVAAQYDDYRLLGELHNYVSGYSNMIVNRIDENGAKALALAEHYYELAGDSKSLASIKNNQAYTLLGNGRVGEAQALYREAIALVAESGDAYNEAFFTARLGSTYLRTGDYRRAEFLYKKSIETLYQIGLDKVATNNEIELGIAYYLQGRHAEAITLYQDLLAKISADVWVEESLRIHTELARNFLAAGDNVKARMQTELAASFLDRVNRLDFRLENAAVTAQMLLAEHNHADAITLLNSTLAGLEREFQESEQQLELYRVLSKSYFESGQNELAISTGRRALRTIADIRNQVDFSRQGPTLGAKTAAIVAQHIDQLLAWYENSNNVEHLNEAFANIQQSKSLSLRQARAWHALRDPLANQQQSTKLLKLWQEMNAANEAFLAASISGQSLQSHTERLLAAQEAYRQVETSVTPAMVGQVDSALSISDIQQRIDANTLVVSFHVGEQASYRLAISKHEWNLQKLPGAAQIKETTSQFMTAITSRSAVPADIGKEISAMVLPENLSTTNGRTVIVEPDAAISELPFAAIALRDSSTYDLAINHLAMIQTGSLSSYFANAKSESTNETNAKAIAIFADPVFADIAHSSIGSVVTSAKDTATADLRDALTPLPFTRLEAAAIEKSFKSYNPLIYLGEEASISNLLSPVARNASILHIATHGFASPENPDLSGLALSPEPDHATGLLTVEELGSVEFHNRLVVISGCETGQGKLLTGEGIMSLSRVFLAQGAGAVIATLWPVSDRATASFMNHFYQSLTETTDVGKALQMAQQSMARSSEYRNPWFWSGFILNVADSNALSVVL